MARRRRALRAALAGRRPNGRWTRRPRVDAGGAASQRLADGHGGGLSRMAGHSHALRDDDPQSRLSGAVLAREARRAGRSRARVRSERDRVPWPALLSEGRHLLRLPRHHRQRDLRAGNHPARIRLRASWPAGGPRPRGQADRHPERHRRRLGAGRERGRRSPDRPGRVEGSERRGGAQVVWPGRQQGAAVRHHLSARPPEGRRPFDRGGR